jgi:uncharacterized RDD family membrane protein YckC
MKFNCPHCNQKIDAPEEYAGQNIGCPSCQKPIQVPAPAVAPKLSIGTKPPVQETPIETPATPASPAYVNAAPLVPRIMAKILDFVIVGAVMIGLALTSHYIVVMLYKNGVSIETQHIVGTCFLFVTCVFPFLYNYLPLAGTGASFGKKTFGLKVVRHDGRRLGYDFALWRCLAEYACVAACIWLAGAIFVGATRAQMHALGPHRHGPLQMLFTLPVFALGFLPYLPAFFTKGCRAVHDLIVQTRVIK